MFPTLPIALLIFALSDASQVTQVRSSVAPNGLRGDFCNLAVVRLDRSRSLRVRGEPNRQSRTLDGLRRGQRVYACQQQGEWLRIAYHGPNAPCEATHELGLEASRSRSCRSGWVHRDFIDILTG